MRPALLNGLLFVGTVVLLEAALRQLVGGMEHVLLYERGGGGTQSCGGLRPGAAVDYTGWFLKVPPIRQEVNGLGYRGAERAPGKPAGVLRIAAVGDSFTYGLDVEAPASLPARLEGVLAGHERDVEVLNFGVPGSALEDTIVRVREFVPRWRPDVVLFFLYADDLEQPLCRFKDPGDVVVRLIGGHYEDVLARPGEVAALGFGILTWKSYILRLGALGYRIGSRWWVGGGTAWTAEMADGLTRLTRASEAMGARLAVVALGDPSVYRRSSALDTVMERERIPWLDARGWLFGGPAERLPRIPGDTHLTAEGNRIAAARVAEWLEATDLVGARRGSR